MKLFTSMRTFVKQFDSH